MLNTDYPIAQQRSSAPRSGGSHDRVYRGCTCGAVRYAITAEPIRGFYCQVAAIVSEIPARDTPRSQVFPSAAMTVSGDVAEN